MNLLKNIPLLGLVLAIYNIAALAGDESLNKILFEAQLMSGGKFVMDFGQLLMFLGIIFLAIEVIKSTRTANSSILDHGLSIVILIIFIVEFITVAKCGTATFLILAFMSLVDVIVGFTVTLSASKRDVNYGDRG
jgi:quinol-cytochrome oxidoreductase complex cytochrome b subunit